MKTRQTNRIFTLFLALVMLMSLAIPAFAAGDEPPEKELRMVHLQWNDKGCYADEAALDKNNGDGPVSGFGYSPARDDAVLFFIWNNKTQQKESYVVPKGDGNLVVEKIDKEAIASGAKQSSYYVHVQMNEFKDGEVTANGLSFQFIAMLDDFGFYSSDKPSTETMLGSEVKAAELTGNTVYLCNSYAGTDEAKNRGNVVSAEKNPDPNDGNTRFYEVEKVSDDCWKIVYQDTPDFFDPFISLKLQVKAPDGSTNEDWRNIRIVHEHEEVPSLWVAYPNWNEDGTVTFNPESLNNGTITSWQNYPNSGLVVGTCDTGEDGRPVASTFKPIAPSELTASTGLFLDTDVSCQKGDKYAKYYFNALVDAMDKDYTISYKEFSITVSSKPTDIDIYKTPSAASAENKAGIWGAAFHPVNRDEPYYIISTCTDMKNGRHLTDAKLKQGAADNALVNLEEVSNDVYKLTIKKDANLEREYFLVELELTWADFMGNTWTEPYEAEFKGVDGASLLASGAALTDGTKADPELLAYSTVAGKVSTGITLNVGEKKDVYLYLSRFFASGDGEQPSWKVWTYPGHGAFHTDSSALTITEDENDFSKLTLSASAAGTYEIWLGGEQWDYENMKLFHADGKEYSAAEWKKFDETIMCRIYEDGTIKVKPIDADDSEYVDFEEMFPGERYELKSLGLMDYGFQRVTVTVQGEGKTFTDVKPDDWFYDDVAYVAANKLMYGVSDTEFNPSGAVNRAMVPTVLYRVEGEPTAPAGNFTDVATGMWYTDAINWSAENDIVKGKGNGIFDVKSNITHEQLAAMLYRYAEFKGCDMSVSKDLSAFTDGNKVSSWALKEVQWAVGTGIISDKSTSLDPQGVATRAELAAYLARFYRDVL